MRIVIAGAHGQIALRLGRILDEQGHDVIGIVRNPKHGPDLANAGVQTVVLDLEEADASDVVPAVRGADAVIFAAGAGPGSGAARKDTVDRGAAALLAEAAEAAGVRGYILISAMGVDTEPPADTSPVFREYLKAKGASETDLKNRDLDWLILRPGRLTNEEGTGLVHLARSVDRAEVTRDDVAAVIAKFLGQGLKHQTLELVGGDTPIAEAVASFAN